MAEEDRLGVAGDDNVIDRGWNVGRRLDQIGGDENQELGLRMDEIARAEGLNDLFESDVVTRERALDWVGRYYRANGDYPNTSTGMCNGSA